MNLIRLVSAISFAASLVGAEIRCVGVLGNSGEAGATLVRFDDRRDFSARDGLGVVLDGTGTLWDRAGGGRLVRYALDGRALATVPIPMSLAMRDRLAVVDDTLVLLINGRICTVDTTTAEPRTVETPLTASSISRGSADGRLMVLEAEPPPAKGVPKPAAEPLGIFTWDPKSGARSDLPLPPPGANAVELAAGVPVVRLSGGQVLRLEKDAWVEFATCKEDRPQFVAGAWWTFAWHGTAKRFDSGFAPAPGVVLGGASGSVIGHLDGNYEMSCPTAIAAVGDRQFALGGMNGVVHIARWDQAAGTLELVRRIGALQQLRGHLVLDRKGRIHVPCGTWSWNDGPDAPLRDGIGGGGNGQVALLPSGALAGSVFIYGSDPSMVWGTLDKEVNMAGGRSIGIPISLPKDVIGCVALPADGGRRVLRITATGAVSESLHGNDGKPQKELATGTATFSVPKTRITSLAVTADGRVLAGADGCLLELARGAREGDWSEASRITAIGGQALSGDVRITGSDERLWLSDGGNHRVLVCDQKLSAIIATFGGGAGNDLLHLDHPAEITAASERAVVYDAGNQRLLKLELR